MAIRSDIDWELIERDYRIGVLTIPMLVEKHGVSKASIHRTAAKNQWTRDLSVQVQAATKAKINAAIVKNATEIILKRDSTNAFEVESQSSINAQIVLKHQRVAAENTTLLDILTQYLKEQVTALSSIKEIVELLKAHHPSALKELYKAIALSTYVTILKQITELHMNIIKVERQAFNIDAEEAKPLPALEAAILRLEAKRLEEQERQVANENF